MSEVVVVTGAAGFLGLKVVELLNQRGRNIQEIRGFDICPRQPPYFVQNSRLTYHQGDICDYEQVKAVLKEATVVIHTAAIIHGDHVSEIRMHAVNVAGTENVINACIECSVSKFVFTCTVDVMMGWSDNFNLDESSTLPGDDVSDYLFGQYAFTKMQAEKRVLAANGSRVANGSSLVTCSLRAATMYGERDRVFIPVLIDTAKSHFGYLPRMGNADSKVHLCYVGNAAWAHVRAVEVMFTNPVGIAGKAFCIGDHTPEDNFFDATEPFLAAADCTLLSISIPYAVMVLIAVILEFIAWILQPFCKLSVPFSRCSVFLVCKGMSISWKKAKNELGYEPIYAYEESKNNTIRYLVEKYLA